jgi:glutamate formiminotransferase
MAPPWSRSIDALLECVPNISEGRDRALVWELGDAVERATMALARLAVERIDMRRHHGVHPRVGAVDVVPFVPLRGLSMAQAVDSARRVGRGFSDATGVPVFFYAEAATNLARRELPIVRWGGFEGLAERLADPAWRPDCGAATPHPTAGVTIVGARGPLIAFNAMLDTPDVAVATSIATAIRKSTPGGLPRVRAMGVYLESRGVAQVSMNLLDSRVTPPSAVAERVAEEARRRGAGISQWELVGCGPTRLFAGLRTPGITLNAGSAILDRLLEAPGLAAGRAGAR